MRVSIRALPVRRLICISFVSGVDTRRTDYYVSTMACYERKVRRDESSISRYQYEMNKSSMGIRTLDK
nr:hypothetical protein CFP56_10248 [Quercus suber]